jgi:glycosyltransferase involved in cell wall biosynthesis
MTLAFYAPLKPPDHPVPSGDRTVARALLRALRLGGHRVEVASRLRSHDVHGCARHQGVIARRGEATVARLLRRYHALPLASRPRAWFTYHLYHKAPDWLGPVISRELGIPYLVAEASHAEKQRGGPWTTGLAAAEAAIRSADALICLNPADEPGLRQLLRSTAGGTTAGGERLHRLRPFVDVTGLRRAAGLARAPRRDARATPRLLCVGMMRRGDKLASYRLLARAMQGLADLPWTLDVVGDGDARASVEEAFAGVVPQRLRFRGRLQASALARAMAMADLLVWPAVNEAWGMVFLEAAALGLPCVAGDAGGVRSVVRHGRTGMVTAAGDAAAFAAEVAALLQAPARLEAMGCTAWSDAERLHDLPQAARRLDEILATVR